MVFTGQKPLMYIQFLEYISTTIFECKQVSFDLPQVKVLIKQITGMDLYRFQDIMISILFELLKS